MKHNYLILAIVATFFLGFIVPMPDARVEKIISNNVNQNKIIGNSIIGHSSPCDNEKNPLEINFDIYSNGGLLIEEYLFAIKNKKVNSSIFIGGTYNIVQPFYYNYQTHTYYKTNLKLNKSGFIKKELWNTSNEININNKYYSSNDLKYIVTPSENLRCKNTLNQNLINFYDAIFSLTYKNFEINRELLKLFSNKKIDIILISPYYDRNFISPEIFIKLKKLEEEILALSYENITIHLFRENLNINDYDEPWCFCSHLSYSGLKKLEMFVNSLEIN